MERLVAHIDVGQHQPRQSLLTEARSEQIGTELAKDYERARRQLAWVYGLMAIALAVGGWLLLLLLFLPAFVLHLWLTVRLIGRRSEVLLLRLDRTTAKNLAALLNEAGESLVSGRALTPRSNEECIRLGRVLHDLQRKLGPTPLGRGKVLRQNQRLGSAEQPDC